MKHIKKFENMSKPEIGDYILANITDNKYNDEITIKIKNFLNDNIGRVIDTINNNAYIVQYYNIPNDILNFFNHKGDNYNDEEYKNYRHLKMSDILYFSNNLFDIEMIKNSHKYNL